jgi:hypothetical protein
VRALHQLLLAYAVGLRHACVCCFAAVKSADGKSWTLQGRKMWISNGKIADLVVVVAYTQPSKVCPLLPSKEKVVRPLLFTHAHSFFIHSLTHGRNVHHNN